MKQPRKNRLRELRGQGVLLSIEDVAKLLDLDVSTVSRDETGQRPLSPERIGQYAKLYRVASHRLFFNTEPESVKSTDS